MLTGVGPIPAEIPIKDRISLQLSGAVEELLASAAEAANKTEGGIAALKRCATQNPNPFLPRSCADA
jgi:hypothetical protein